MIQNWVFCEHLRTSARWSSCARNRRSARLALTGVFRFGYW